MSTGALLLLVSALALQPPGRFGYSEIHLGVAVRITGYAPDDSTARCAARAAFAEVARLDSLLSDYRASSDVRAIASAAPGWVVVGSETMEVIGVALRIAARSDGAFDPTIGPLVNLWRESRTTGRLPSSAAIRAAKALTQASMAPPPRPRTTAATSRGAKAGETAKPRADRATRALLPTTTPPTPKRR